MKKIIIGSLIATALAIGGLWILGSFSDKSKAERQVGFQLAEFTDLPSGIPDQPVFLADPDADHAEITYRNSQEELDRGKAITLLMRREDRELEPGKFAKARDLVIRGHRAALVPGGNPVNAYSLVWHEDGFSFLVTSWNVSEKEVIEAAESLKR